MSVVDNRALLITALARVAAAERVALQTVYRLTSAKLFGLCIRILGDRAEAEDVLQEVYMTVWRKAGDFDPARASPMTWLIAIARNRAIDRLRSRASARILAPIDDAAEVADTAPSAEVALESTEAYMRLHGCLQALAGHERGALNGAFFDGNTYEELAERMSVPLGTMKSWVRRAMIKLKACLGE
jgi:RNA polymerase sigma-70 factor (ECF subfamily)